MNRKLKLTAICISISFLALGQTTGTIKKSKSEQVMNDNSVNESIKINAAPSKKLVHKKV